MDPVAMALANAAKRQGKAELVTAMTLQSQVNIYLTDAIAKLAMGDPDGAMKALADVSRASDAVLAQLETWLSQGGSNG